MIEREFKKYFGVCDVCFAETPKFNTWGEAKYHMKGNGWKNTRNKTTGEWENHCPACKALKNTNK